MAGYNASPGNGRKSTSSRPAHLIDVPIPGSINVSDEEDLGQPVPRNPRSGMQTPRKHAASFSPHHSLGLNTLSKPKLTLSHTEVPTGSFYQRQDNAITTRGKQRPTRTGTHMNAMLAGVPGRQTWHYRQSPPPQNRNATLHMARGKKTEKTSRAKGEETIEITDSSEDEGMEAADPDQRSISQRSSCKTAGGSGSVEVTGRREGQDIFGGEARVPNLIRRKSESPPEDSKWSAAGAGIRILPPRKASPELDPLPENRSFHIATAKQDEIGDKAQRPMLANRMKDKDGNKHHLGGHMESGLRRKRLVGVDIDVKESPSRPSLPIAASPSIQQRRLRLANIGFFGLAQITSTTTDPTVLWNDDGDLELRWKQLGRQSLICQIGNMKLIEMYDESPSHCLSISFMDPERVITRLCDLVGEAGSAVLKRACKTTDHIILRPLTDDSRGLIEGQLWKDLLNSLSVSLASKASISNGHFHMLSTEFAGLQDLVKVSEAAGKTAARQPRPRPTAAGRSIQSGQVPLPISLRRKKSASSTGEEDEKASKASVEAVTKVQAPTEPQKALLSYPIAAPGAVNVFQSDLDKLNDQEMLNDTIVELGLRYLLEAIKKRDPDLHEQIYVFSSFFYKRISEGRRDRKAAYEFVKKWTKKVDIFKKKYLVVPINERLHWYLAVVTNPYYAVREVERRKGLYESEPEEDEKDVDSEAQVNDDVPLDEMGKKEEGESAAGVEEAEKRLAEQRESMGDTPMEETRNTTVEVDHPQSSHKSDKSPKSGRDNNSEKMDLDEKPIFEMVESPELEERAVEHRTLTTPVVDKRTAKIAFRNAIDLDEDDDDNDVQVVTHSISPRRAKQSPYRPGISDGIRNKGRGSLVGGGGLSGTPIEAGQIASFQKDQEEEATSAAATKKRKAKDEDGDGDARMESPLPRSRSGAVYNRNPKPATFSRASSTETIQEKHQHWLKQKAVVCVFDSLGGTHKAVRTALREYLCLEYNDKRGGQIEVDEVELEYIDVVSPMQGNFCDCGLYLLHAFERFFHDPSHVMDEVIVLRDRTDPYWQAEGAAKKRQWWRECIASLIEEYKIVQAQTKADKEARKRESGNGGKEKSETTSSSDASETATSGESPIDMASVESSLAEPNVSKAT